ncbi:putative ribonuclease H-like domain-containing protein [Tanacetum coccineum]
MQIEESLNVRFDESPSPKSSLLLDADIIEKPKNIKEAIKDESWIMAMQEELNQFVTNDVWNLVPPPKDQTIIGTKWVFKNKLDENGVVSRNKSRLVAQGYNCNPRGFSSHAINSRTLLTSISHLKHSSKQQWSHKISQEGSREVPKTRSEAKNQEKKPREVFLDPCYSSLIRNYQEESFTHKEDMALMAFSDSECDDLLDKLNESEFKAATYKRGLATAKARLITYRKNEKFDKASKDLDQLLGSLITDKSKKGLGYSAVPLPHPLIYNRPNKLDLSYSGLDEFKEPEFKGYGPEKSKQESNVVCDKESKNSKENSDESLVEEQVSQDKSSFVESSPNVDKETVFPDFKVL